jgi:GNAT superfamily N-acetyltransferase
MSFHEINRWLIDPIGDEVHANSQPPLSSPDAIRDLPEHTFRIYDSESGQPTGGIWLYFEHSNTDPCHGVITGLHVNMEHRGKGIGGLAIGLAEHIAETYAAGRIDVGAVDNAVGFYVANGFVITDQQPSALVHMTKLLR